jgi:nucleoside-diphosphate-sugar epimerase
MNTLLAIGLGYSAKEIALRLASSVLPLANLYGERQALNAGEVGAERRVTGLDDDSEHTSPSPGMLRIPPSPARGEGEQAANSLPEIDTRDNRESALSPGGRGRREAPGEGGSWRIIGTSRDADGVAEIEALGHEALQFAGDAPSAELARAIGEATHILHSAPPSAEGDPMLVHHEADLATAPHLEWIGYLSTIGVYGDTGGAWIDETAAPNPASERSKQRWAAEQAWMDFAARHSGVTLQVFRLAGIYGPGRSSLERLRAGAEKRIDKPDQVFNRIHRDDIAATVLAGIRAGATASGVYNVTDDEPAPPQDIVTYAAGLLGIEPPPLIPWEEAEKSMTSMARSFYLETKRVRNDRIKGDLGVKLSYPTYREGLSSLHEKTTP